MIEEKKIAIDDYFNTQFELYRNSIFKLCMSKLNCDIELSEDCTQETFVVFYNRLKKGERFENPRAFLYRTAQNYILKAVNKRAKKTSNETDLNEDTAIELVSHIDSVENDIDYSILTDRIYSVLDDDERRLFDLRFVDDMSVNDIALELGIKPTACSMRINRMRQKMKRIVLDYFGKECHYADD